jgi:predicted O-methyltransferase YrrM
MASDTAGRPIAFPDFVPLFFARANPARIGSKGKIVGIEQSPDMITKARTRIKENHWDKVSLVNAPVETARIRVKADAALFHLTHDVLLQPEAVANVVRHLKPGARVVASGLKWAGAWAVPVNSLVWMAARHSTTSLRGLQEPWRGLAEQLGPMNVETMWGDGIYVASRRVVGQD